MEQATAGPPPKHAGVVLRAPQLPVCNKLFIRCLRVPALASEVLANAYASYTVLGLCDVLVLKQRSIVLSFACWGVVEPATAERWFSIWEHSTYLIAYHHATFFMWGKPRTGCVLRSGWALPTQAVFLLQVRGQTTPSGTY